MRKVSILESGGVVLSGKERTEARKERETKGIELMGAQGMTT